MIDEIYDRNYRAGRDQLNSAIFDLIRRFGGAVGNAFSVLNRIEYSAPWMAPRRRGLSPKP
jgi:hypothetical protein